MFTEREKRAPQQQPLVPGGEWALGHEAPAVAGEAEGSSMHRARLCTSTSSAGKCVRQQRRRSDHWRDNWGGGLWRKWDLERSPPGQHLPTATVLQKMIFFHLQAAQISVMCNTERKQSYFLPASAVPPQLPVKNLTVPNPCGWGGTGVSKNPLGWPTEIIACWKGCTQGSRMYAGN